MILLFKLISVQLVQVDVKLVVFKLYVEQPRRDSQARLLDVLLMALVKEADLELMWKVMQIFSFFVLDTEVMLAEQLRSLIIFNPLMLGFFERVFRVTQKMRLLRFVLFAYRVARLEGIRLAYLRAEES